MDIKEFMKLKKLSYRKLAELAGIDPAMLHKYATGKRVPQLKNAIKLVEVSKNKIKYTDLLKGAEDEHSI